MSAAPAEGFEVGDLDAAGVLEVAAVDVRAIGVLEARQLRLAAHWADLHPATVETGAASWSPQGAVLEAEELLGGAGTPSVAAWAPEELGAVLGLSPDAARALVADALDLRHRLRLTWRRVQRGQLPAWLARRVAQQTRELPAAGAKYVDEVLALRATGWGTVTLDRVVAEAVARFDPVEQARREDRGRGSWDVRVQHPRETGFAGTSDLSARGDSVVLQRFVDLVTVTAAGLKAAGDSDPVGVRRAKALGVITDLATGQAALELTGRGGVAKPERTRLYVHLDATDLADLDTTDTTDTAEGSSSVGVVERLGPVSVARVREWLAGTRVTVVPVLDLTGEHSPLAAVDAHDPSERMRELVMLRDRHCVFPGCRREARGCDLDHIDPYQDPDEGGPPGQTRPECLACLCRRHHRAKTSRGWSYQRVAHATYLWRSPRGRSYLVTPTGTHTLT